MKALVIGCGSIGRRHINNLTGFKEVKKIFVYTRIRPCLDILDNRTGKIEVVSDPLKVDTDFALICNETHKHIDSAVALAKKGINIFVEKPLAKSLEDALRLKRIIAKKKITVAVGYNLRFLDAITLVKAMLAKGDIGKLYFARIEVGQYLPDWRKSIDYRNSYSAHRNRGGGVDLDLSHEIDYMRYFFGDPAEWEVAKGKVSSLKIDSDDVFEGMYRYKDNFICSVHMDYLQRKKKRLTRIVGSKGTILLDLAENKIILERPAKTDLVIRQPRYFDLNKTYKDELKDFMASVKSRRSPKVGIDDGIKALRLLKR